MARAILVLILGCVLSLALAGLCRASWSMSSSGVGRAGATSVGAGKTPTGSVAAHTVTLNWSASTFSSGGTLGSYRVQRYDSATGVAQTVAAGCAGTVAATTCAEAAVPTGVWTYSVTPLAGSWAGAEGPGSLPVIVLP